MDPKTCQVHWKDTEFDEGMNGRLPSMLGSQPGASNGKGDAT